MKQTHLTLTGILAGTPICGDARNEHDDYVHAIYYERIQDNESVCVRCKEIFTSIDEEIENEYV